MERISFDELRRLDARALGEVPAPDCCVYRSTTADCRLPRRRTDTHKYSYGRALIIAGKEGYSGAAWLAANACEKSGAGLTVLLVPRSIYPIAASRCCGAVVRPMPADEDGGFSALALRPMLQQLESADACLIGPGLGTGAGARALVQAVLENARCPLLLDADGINLLAGHIDALDNVSVPVVLTPHEGEFRRLGGSVENGRLNGVCAFVSAHPCVTVLKGHRTLIADGSGAVWVNETGGPALAKGGSGDTLSGILTAFLAQGFDPVFSARTAVLLHGLAGDLASARLGEYCVTPGDVLEALPRAFAAVTED